MMNRRDDAGAVFPVPLEPIAINSVINHLDRIGVHPKGKEIMAPKSLHHSFLIDGLDTNAANFLKQGLLSLGGECAVPYHVLAEGSAVGSCMTMATSSQYTKLFDRLRLQPYGLPELARRMQDTVVALERPLRHDPWRTLELHTPKGTMKLEIGNRTRVMGILNLTPDSFYDGGNYPDVESAVKRGLQMADEGADVIDIGGESSRPFSDPVSVDEELERVIPVLEKLSSMVNIPISIDTYKPEVARPALEAGASMVNDISGLQDDRMVKLVADTGAAVIIMHMKGEPRNMQLNPEYRDAPSEIYTYLARQVHRAEAGGIGPEAIIIDPGIGFGKTVLNNLEILERMRSFRGLGRPLLVGASNKSFIGAVLDRDVHQRLNGSLAASVAAVMRGVDMVRVHNVRETREAVDLADAILRASVDGRTDR